MEDCQPTFSQGNLNDSYVACLSGLRFAHCNLRYNNKLYYTSQDSLCNYYGYPVVYSQDMDKKMKGITFT